MRTISHWYTVEGLGYWANGQYRRSYLQYPVYTDEVTPYELELQRQFATKRRLDAEGMVLDSYIQVEKKRAELARLTQSAHGEQPKQVSYRLTLQVDQANGGRR